MLQEYSLEVDSAAISDIYGNVTKPIKQSLKVKGEESYSTLLVTIPDTRGKNLVVQLLNSSDAVVKQVVTRDEKAKFSYVNPETYYLRLFIDENENGIWDTGLYEADRQPESVFYYHEPIECKAKWDVTKTWRLTERPLFRQKPEKITKQKGEQQKTIRNKNAERAKQLGITYKR